MCNTLFGGSKPGLEACGVRGGGGDLGVGVV